MKNSIAFFCLLSVLFLSACREPHEDADFKLRQNRTIENQYWESEPTVFDRDPMLHQLQEVQDQYDFFESEPSK